MGHLTENSSSDSFDTNVLQPKIPVLVDFWAAWCKPCKMILPLLEEAATEYAGQITIVKVDVEKNQEIVSRYNVRGVPTLILFRNGVVIEEKVGLISKIQLFNFISKNIMG